jgi:hypothetical protein
MRLYSDTHNFKSNVQRFQGGEKTGADFVGPGNYNVNNTSVLKQSFNRNQDAYTGSKQPRFDDTKIRPHLGPGAYFVV